MADITKISAFVQSSPHPAWLATRRGECSCVNPALEQLTGLKSDQTEQVDWRSFVLEEDRAAASASWQSSLTSGTPCRTRVRLRGFDGVPATVELIAFGHTLNDGTEVWLFSGLHVHGGTQQYPGLEAQLQATLNLIPAYTWYALPSGGLTFVNERTADYLGLPKDHPLRFGIDTGAEWDAHIPFLHPDDREEARRVWSVCLNTNSAGENSQRVLSAGGGYCWFISRVEPLRSSNGAILYWIGVNLDIDEQKRAEEKIREQEIEFRQILDLTPQLVSVYGPNRERVYANRVMLAYLGLSLEEWRRRSKFGESLHPDDWERVILHFDRAVSSGAGFELEFRLRKGDGGYRWFLARCNPVRDDTGEITRWYIACADIDDRKRAEQKLQQENVALREEIDKASMFEEIVGTSKPLKAVLSRIARAAPTDSTVLITGETGTGKELFARAVHKRSQRSVHPFISVNCAALPPTLVFSELFGHEKGAFTGATQRRLGRFEMADGGTIFLDEVGELLPDTQAALLRVLQEREFERVGGGQPIHTDVRVIAATNRDLNAAAANGTFRHDLLYRLNVFPIEVPPLRERKEDILMLVEYFVQRYASRAGRNIRSIDKKTLDLLQSYNWPGNIRELQNVIERSIILSSADVFSVDELWLSRSIPSPTPRPETSLAFSGEPRSEREIIEAALAESRGRVSGTLGAAARLRVPPSTLETRIKTLKIDKSQFKFR